MTQTPQGPRPIVITESPIVFSQAERDLFEIPAWDKDTRWRDGKDSLTAKIGSYFQNSWKTQGDIDKLLNEAVATYRDPNKKGQIRFDPDKGKYNFGMPSNLVTGSQGIYDNPKFQAAFYRRLQKASQDDGLKEKFAIGVDANGQPITMTYGEALKSLNQGGLNTARLSGTGFTIDAQGRINNSAGGIAPSVLLGGDLKTGKKGKRDPRADIDVIQKKVREQYANKRLLQNLNQLRISDDLSEDQKKALAKAKLLVDPTQNPQLREIQERGLTAKKERQKDAASKALDRRMYGVVNSETGEITGGTFEGNRARNEENRAKAAERRAIARAASDKAQQKFNNWSTLNAADFDLQRLLVENDIAKQKINADRERVRLQNEATMTRWREEQEYKKSEKDEDRRIEALTKGYGSVGDLFSALFAFI